MVSCAFLMFNFCIESSQWSEIDVLMRAVSCIAKRTELGTGLSWQDFSSSGSNFAFTNMDLVL